MKIPLLIFVLLSFQLDLKAQDHAIKKLYVNELVSTHLICSEPVEYVDISTDRVVGDLPVSNVVRIKPLVSQAGMLGVLTIVTRDYMIQYEIIYSESEQADRQVSIKQKDARSLMLHDVGFTYTEMRTFCTRILQSKIRYPGKRKRAYGIEARFNQIYTVGNYFLVDISLRNHTKIQFDIDQIRFKIADKKITKATNFQEVEIKPEYQFYHHDTFRKRYRNVFVFKKFTFPNKKVFSIELSEKQISGRNIKLEIDYKKVLNADVL